MKLIVNSFESENDCSEHVHMVTETHQKKVNMSLNDVASLSNLPSLSTAVLNAVISLSNLSELIAIFPSSFSSTFCNVLT